MRHRSVLLVEADPSGETLAEAWRRRKGDRVHVARTRAQALAASRRQHFDIAVVDLLLRGGGFELARQLSRRVSCLYLSVGARLVGQEILELALGFPVVRKAEVLKLGRSGPRGPSS
jgi:DNA-binding response OmpR family regulator